MNSSNYELDGLWGQGQLKGGLVGIDEGKHALQV